ncbi:MAG TPA: glutamate--cysteine ligase [Ktedonobacteraceae bacterium]
MFSFGIEHEVAFVSVDGSFIDYDSPLAFPGFSALIEQLPLYPGDYPQLRLGDAGIRVKRWYLEGLERFDDAGHLLTCLAKGIEIRTTIHPTINGALAELQESFQKLSVLARQAGFIPVLSSFHPYQTRFTADPPFNPYEESLLHLSPEDETALLSMITYGPDLNFSLQDSTDEACIDLAQKLTYYSPYIVPFTFSAPFYAGTLWDGLSVRTFLRTGLRPAALVFLDKPQKMLVSNPSLTKQARSLSEVGRIEFKACDSCDDFSLYAALLALLKGLALDKTLDGRALVPDAALHQFAARHGLANQTLARGTQSVLVATQQALAGDPDERWLDPLWTLLQTYEPLAMRLTRDYQATGSIQAALRRTYQSFAENT